MENISQIEIEEDAASKKRIQMYKSILNYYRGRSLSLDHILHSKQANNIIPPDNKTEEGLNRAVQGLYDDVTFIQSIKQCLELLKNSLFIQNSLSRTAVQHRQGILDKIEGIIYFSRYFMKLHEKCPTELEVIKKMKTYSEVLAEYGKSLEALKETQKEENMQIMEKARLQVYKINLIRMMKSVLIGFISVNCPGKLEDVEQFRTPVRRNLTVDDFIDNWTVGLPS